MKKIVEKFVLNKSIKQIKFLMKKNSHILLNQQAFPLPLPPLFGIG